MKDYNKPHQKCWLISFLKRGKLLTYTLFVSTPWLLCVSNTKGRVVKIWLKLFTVLGSHIIHASCWSKLAVINGPISPIVCDYKKEGSFSHRVWSIKLDHLSPARNVSLFQRVIQRRLRWSSSIEYTKSSIIGLQRPYNVWFQVNCMAPWSKKTETNIVVGCATNVCIYSWERSLALLLFF